MTDWEKLKVADLKEELKSRGIPLTGLKLKQQFIDKLNEVESETGNGTVATKEDEKDVEQDLKTDDEKSTRQTLESNAQPVAETSQDPEDEDGDKFSKIQDQDKETGSQIRLEDAVMPDNIGDGIQKFSQNDTSTPSRELTGEERVERLPDEYPAELKKEESYARDGSTPPPFEADTSAEAKTLKQDDPFVPQQQADDMPADQIIIDDQSKTDSSGQMDHDIPRASRVQDHSNGDVQIPTETALSTRVPTPNILDDQRKRKRRSPTPTPASEAIPNKRAKTSGGVPTPTKRESDALQQMQENTNAAQAIRDLDKSGDANMKGTGNPENREIAIEDGQEADIEQRARQSQPGGGEQSPLRPRSHSPPERNVSPAIHPATCSIYIRNFKRPLHIPTLRSHIASLAGSSSNDPLKVFYLDSVRTHAYVSFTSVSAASRVRNAMHGTRFPDEPMREALWIDFVPDAKVQTWIDQETGSSGGGFGGGRGTSKKYEIVYNNDGDNVEALLQEASNLNARGQRPGLQQTNSNRMVPQDRTASAAVASGIHPSRVSLVPASPSASRSRHTTQSQPPPRPSDPGKGFRALDELFSSTTTKPKLYYKLPPQPVIEDRRDMIRDLRVGHDQRGKSGDEGMKRYTFEKDNRGDSEEWVDKGPEFGFGRRGQERLTGFGTSYGSGRGRGGPRGTRRGGDSWRGR